MAPHGGLVQGSDGSFYGTTTFGGTNSNSGWFGTLFKICVPLNPPANQISGLSIADSNVVVAVPSVAGETYQLQYRADFTSGDWSNISDACVSNCIGALLTVTNFGGASAPQGFYRFDITP
jgi:alanine-alpha-ketoisovalerate/valine-pyruvate aminotransferase